MKEKIRFTKMHGCGNDYIYTIRKQQPSFGATAIKVSDLTDLY